jgi:hypothetical protein
LSNLDDLVHNISQLEFKHFFNIIYKGDFFTLLGYINHQQVFRLLYVNAFKFTKLLRDVFKSNIKKLFEFIGHHYMNRIKKLFQLLVILLLEVYVFLDQK